MKRRSKQAALVDWNKARDRLHEFLDKNWDTIVKVIRTVLGAAAGGTIGALAGYVAGSKGKKKVPTVAGGLTGAFAGGAAGLWGPELIERIRGSKEIT